MQFPQPLPSCSSLSHGYVPSLHYPTQLCVRPGLRALILPTHPHSHSPFTFLNPKACISISWLHSSPPELEDPSLTCKRRTRIGAVPPRTGHLGGPSPLDFGALLTRLLGGGSCCYCYYHHYYYYFYFTMSLEGWNCCSRIEKSLLLESCKGSVRYS